MLADIHTPVPARPAPTESGRRNGIVPDSVPSENSQPPIDQDAVPPVDTEASDIRVVPVSSAPVVRLNLKDIPTLATENRKSGAVQPTEFFSSPAAGTEIDSGNSVIVEPARVIKQIIPEYPRKAKAARVQGQVLLKATITETGAVEDIVVIEGHPLLIDAAVAALSHWRYEPAKLHGVPTRAPLNVRVNFRLTFS